MGQGGPCPPIFGEGAVGIWFRTQYFPVDKNRSTTRAKTVRTALSPTMTAIGGQSGPCQLGLALILQNVPNRAPVSLLPAASATRLTPVYPLNLELVRSAGFPVPFSPTPPPPSGGGWELHVIGLRSLCGRTHRLLDRPPSTPSTWNWFDRPGLPSLYHQQKWPQGLSLILQNGAKIALFKSMF